jgi:hypothetical protein
MFGPHHCVTPVGVFQEFSTRFPTAPLHFVQGKRGGLGCFVHPGL